MSTVGFFEVASLFVDETNPRFAAPTNNQREAVNTILNLDPNKLFNLAMDIAETGTLSPAELPIVLREQEEFIVIEGNRRIAALKLLRNPGLADEPKIQRRLEEIARVGVGPEEVLCAMVNSREEARHWIELRHTGENDGVGVVQWQAWQSNNFRRRPGSQADRATSLCNAVLTEFPDDEELKDDVAAVRNQRLTTLGRLLTDPDIRRAFGFDFVNSQVVFYYPNSDLGPSLRKLFRDLANHLSVSHVKSKGLRGQYIRDSSSDLPERENKLDSPRAPGAATESKDSDGPARGNSESTNDTSDSQKGRRRIPQEEKVIFQRLRLSRVDIRIANLLKQAQTIDIESASGVAAVVLRVLVELVVTDTARREGWNIAESDPLKPKIRKALLMLDPNCAHPMKRDKSLEVAWIRSQDEQSGIAVQSMNAFVHNVMAQPTAGEVRELSRTFRTLLERLDAYVATPTKP